MKREERLAWYKDEFESISKEIKYSDVLSHYYFLRIRNFKLQNLTTEDERSVRAATKKAFQLAEEDKIKEAITCLTELRGVAIPIASTILAMKYPNKLAIIDSRVIKKIGKSEWLKGYLKKPEIYEDYLLFLRRLAEERKTPLRELERELFEG